MVAVEGLAVQIPILIEPLEGGRFRAREPFGLSAEGETEDEAFLALRSRIKDCLRSGAKVRTLTVDLDYYTAKAAPADETPEEWVRREFQEAIEENRREADATLP